MTIGSRTRQQSAIEPLLLPSTSRSRSKSHHCGRMASSMSPELSLTSGRPGPRANRRLAAAAIRANGERGDGEGVGTARMQRPSDQLDVEPVAISGQDRLECGERGDQLVHAEQHTRMTVEHRQLVILAKMTGTIGITCCDQPTARLQRPQHLLEACCRVTHMMEGGVAAHDVERARCERQGVGHPTNPPRFGNRVETAPHQHGVVLDAVTSAPAATRR